MKPPATLDTARLHLRPPVLADADVVFDLYARDPDVVRYMTWRPHESAEVTRDFIRACIAGWQKGSTLSWMIVRRQDEQLLGMVTLRMGAFKADLGYVLARRFWGQGYTTEAVKAVADWAIAQPEIHRVWATCDVDNLASARVMEKAGMQREGLLRRWIIHPNISDHPRDSWCYARVN